MCRWMLYYGTDPVLAADIIIKPTHSIITQCYEHYLPDIVRNWSLSTLENVNRVNPCLNGDGFGIGWYVPEVDSTPCVFASATPPWNNRNLLRLSNKIKSSCIFAHVRAAPKGSFVSEANCHPFVFGRYLFMHNGGIPEFAEYKVQLLQSISPKIAAMISGTTDTEHIAAYFIEQLKRDPNEESTLDEIRWALLKTVKFICRLTKKRKTCYGCSERVCIASSLNFAVTDGNVVLATRFRNHPREDPPSLYYNISEKVSLEDGLISVHASPSTSQHHPITENEHRVCLIASEPLTYHGDEWKLLPKNHLICVDSNFAVTKEQIYIGTFVHVCFKRWRSYHRKPRPTLPYEITGAIASVIG
eukprot:TRINITY_DN16525_c0_g1_i1.p1 TRINITY_DN16525_c0_g1~~TRINITY_DN16525_c0_g1_i1.p1  ORF type:complete len:397 (+),score=44.60 TRINITY_DN16525_c0_g1_i1:117-1193(+)